MTDVMSTGYGDEDKLPGPRLMDALLTVREGIGMIEQFDPERAEFCRLMLSEVAANTLPSYSHSRYPDRYPTTGELIKAIEDYHRLNTE